MMQHQALSGCIDSELQLFTTKFDLLTNTLNTRKSNNDQRPPKQREEQFKQLLTSKHLPTFEINPPDKTFDMERFLELRTSKEAQDFRQWMLTIQNVTTEEINGQVNTLRERFGLFVRTNTGKTIRLAINTAIGAIPLYGAPLGAGFGAINTFILERLLPVSGPTLFLSNEYKSIFQTSTT